MSSRATDPKTPLVGDNMNDNHNTFDNTEASSVGNADGFYETLGIPQSATPAQIKKAYHKVFLPNRMLALYNIGRTIHQK